MTICGISIKRNKLQCKLERKKPRKIVINVSYKIQIKFVKLFLWYFYKENNLTWRKKRREKIWRKKKKRKKKSKSLGSLPSLLECQTPGALDRRWLGITGGLVTYPVILLVSEFPKEVTDVLAVGLESQESDCTRAPRTRDPINGEATFRPQSVTERATLTSRQMCEIYL